MPWSVAAKLANPPSGTTPPRFNGWNLKIMLSKFGISKLPGAENLRWTMFDFRGDFHIPPWGKGKWSTQNCRLVEDMLVQKEGKHQCICTVFSLERYLWLDWWMVLLFKHLPYSFSLTLILFAPRRDDMQFTPAHNWDISGSTYQNIAKDSQDRLPCNHHGNWKTCLEGVSFMLYLLRSLFQFRLSKISPSSFRTLHAAP